MAVYATSGWSCDTGPDMMTQSPGFGEAETREASCRSQVRFRRHKGSQTRARRLRLGAHHGGLQWRVLREVPEAMTWLSLGVPGRKLRGEAQGEVGAEGREDFGPYSVVHLGDAGAQWEEVRPGDTGTRPPPVSLSLLPSP